MTGQPHRRARVRRARPRRSQGLRRRVLRHAARRRDGARRASSSAPACGSSTWPPTSASATRRSFERWYKMPHACPDLLAESVYGLPEVNREAIRKARIVGNPGCYPTAVQLGFLPLVEAGIVDTEHLIADCKSGVSGAGRKAELEPDLPRGGRQLRGLRRQGPPPPSRDRAGARARVAASPVKLAFTPHLTPMIRGIFATLYAPLRERRRRPAGAVREALRRRAVRRRHAAGIGARHALACARATSAASPSTGRRGPISR